MEDVTSKNNGIAQTFAQLGRPALPSSASESVSTTGGRQLDFTINESKEDVDVPSTRIDAAVVSDDYSSLMTALGTLVLSQGLQSQLQSQPMTADPTSYGLASVDGTFAPAFTAANFQNYQPTMADLYGLQSDGEVVGNFAQQCQQMWPRHDMIAQHRGAPMLSFPADDRNQTGTWGNLQNPSAWPSASGRAGPNVRSGFNHHGRSMSAQNLNMTGVGQSSLRPNDYASGLNSMISGYRHGKPFADQMQRSRFGSSFSSLLENDSKNSNLENETALIQGNQNAILLDFLRNASGSTGQSAGTFPFGVQDLRHLLKDSSGSCSDAAARFTSLNLLKSSSSSTLQSGIDMGELYSRKVFVGGLPPDIDEEEILTSFHRFGSVLVDWPHKTESKSYFPPKGYCFLLFEDEKSVQGLVRACVVENGKLYWHVTSPTMKDKAVQIRPWKLSDCDFVMDGAQPLDPRKTVFVGGVPRPMRAVELAMVMARMYGPVCYAGIDTDPDLKYPKGAGRVTFTSQQSFLAAINSRFVQLQHGDIDKRVEVKPYVLEDQICDECQGLRSGGKHAPFFCANVVCLQYYCDHCWTVVHSNPGREFHKPLVKDGADRPRTMPFRLC